VGEVETREADSGGHVPGRLRRLSGTVKRPLALAPPRAPRLSPDVQVVVGIVSLLALLAVAIVTAVLLIVDVKDDATQLTEREVLYATAISAAALNAKAIANDERGFLLSGRREFIRELDVRIGNARAAFAVASSSADTAAQHEAVVEANVGFERWVAALNEETAIYEAGEREEAVETSLGPTRALRKAYERSLARAQALGADSLESAQGSVSATTRRSIVILLAYLVLALAVGIFVARSILRTLRPFGEGVNGRDEQRRLRIGA
jgi:methyl-accepting chemotaxis protein